MTLHLSTSNAATLSLSTYGSVTNQVANANGYATSGNSFNNTWTLGASAGQYRFNTTSIRRLLVGECRNDHGHQVRGDLVLGRLRRRKETARVCDAIGGRLQHHGRQQADYFADGERLL
jgi:hypothetical protein